MNKQLTFSFIGGDLRQTYVISALAADGFHVRMCGLDKAETDFAGEIYPAKSASECTAGADVVVLPLPYSADSEMELDKKTVNTPLGSETIKLSEVLGGMNENTILFAGKADAALVDACMSANIRVIDYANRDELAVMNAIPTAEGAIEVAMANTRRTLHGSCCMVVGYGKIGKILSADLRALGAVVTATARKYSDLAWIEANGCRAAKTSEISEIAGEFDIIFNTVPHKVLDFKVLPKTRRDVLIIDLASKPGGVDFELARELGRRTIWALSIPGKVAPESAGNIIKNTLINILEELGV